MEEWRNLIYHNINYGEYYLVSNKGRIKNARNNYVLKNLIGPTGYYYVTLSLGSRESRKVVKVHRCVAESFLENLYNLPIINHKDGDKLNNNVSNLEFCSYQYNVEHAIAKKLFDPKENKCKIVVNKTLGMVFESIFDAGRWVDKNNPDKARKNIQRDLKSKSHKAYGYILNYV